MNIRSGFIYVGREFQITTGAAWPPFDARIAARVTELDETFQVRVKEEEILLEKFSTLQLECMLFNANLKTLAPVVLSIFLFYSRRNSFCKIIDHGNII